MLNESSPYICSIQSRGQYQILTDAMRPAVASCIYIQKNHSQLSEWPVSTMLATITSHSLMTWSAATPSSFNIPPYSPCPLPASLLPATCHMNGSGPQTRNSVSGEYRLVRSLVISCADRKSATSLTCANLDESTRAITSFGSGEWYRWSFGGTFCDCSSIIRPLFESAEFISLLPECPASSCPLRRISANCMNGVTPVPPAIYIR